MREIRKLIILVPLNNAVKSVETYTGANVTKMNRRVKNILKFKNSKANIQLLRINDICAEASTCTNQEMKRTM